MFSMQEANASGAKQTDLQRFCKHGQFLSLCVCALQPDSAKKRPVTLSTRFGTTHAREDILFYDNPSTVVVYAQPFGNYAKGHTALTQFTKDSVLYRCALI